MDPRQIEGKTIAHFKILQSLASGGMANVYKAVDVQLDRTVVLKILDADLLGDDGARRRFLREARLASSLDHPNICTIYEIHEADGVYYIAMQYVEGNTLKRTINGHPLATPALLSIALQVADAVARAHDRGIIHRDIKPQNIMITPRGQAKVLDFGLGKNLEESTSHPASELTVLGSPFGTPSYMSPEQARGERTDRRGDVFSFGIVLYEMATGRKPFNGKNHVEIYYAICNKFPPPIADLNPYAPSDLQVVVDRAMAKDPADRYQSMHELLSDLKRISANIQLSSPVPDGINQPYVPIKTVRAGWIDALLPPFFRKRPEPTGVLGLNDRESDEQRVARAITPTDDFPIIPGLHKALAVLPFRSLGEETDDNWQYLLLEALVAELAKFKSLTIRPTSTVTRYTDRSVNPSDVGRELGADAVLAGSYLRSGNKLRVTSQLIESSTGGVLWASKIDLPLESDMETLDTVCERLIEGLVGRQLGTDTLDLLHDDSEEIRLDGIAMMMYSHDDRAVDALAEALGDSSPRVQSAAAEALGRFGRDAATVVTTRLEDATEGGDFSTARYAAKAAGLIGSSETLAPLLEALSCDDSMLASEAALSLGRLGDERARPDLVEALERSDASVRFTSAQALGELCDPRAIGALELRGREDEDEGVRAKAQWAVSHIRRSHQASRSKPSGSLSPELLRVRSEVKK
ncbi:MAG TPA: protein kinase [Blastocatellia bacterium]|nr:protein kinase [Blastocatellia bacterium]